MDNWNSQSGDIEWVERVYELLREIIRCSLSENPKMPDNISQKALPLIQKIPSIQQRPGQQVFKSISPGALDDREWVEQVRKLFVEMTGAALSERPRLPENLASRALKLADGAKKIKGSIEEYSDTSPAQPIAEYRDKAPVQATAESSLQSPESLLDLLQQSLKTQRAKSYNPDAAEWQQIFTMLDVVRSVYQQIKH
ncbi:MAG: inorganic pyrophosphatase [Microcoleus sp.]